MIERLFSLRNMKKNIYFVKNGKIIRMIETRPSNSKKTNR